MEDKNEFYISIKDADGKEFEIPLQGSLGLLALGDVGLMTWRKKKLDAYQKLKGLKIEDM